MVEILDLSLPPSSAAVARSPGYISSSLSGRHDTVTTTVRGATCLRLRGHTTNSTGLALIEPVFLFRGSCLVSLSLCFTLTTLLSSHNLYGRLRGSDQLLVSSLSYVWHRSATSGLGVRYTRKCGEALSIVLWCYLAVVGGGSVWAVMEVSWVDICWGTSPIRYQIPILFVSLCKEKEGTHKYSL